MKIRARVATIALAATLFVSAAAPAAWAVVIRTDGQSWNPARVTITRGTRVTWRRTSGTHTVTAYGGNWSFNQQIDASDPTASKVFRNTGRYKFRCTFHSTLSAGVCSGMCGRVRVTT